MDAMDASLEFGRTPNSGASVFLTSACSWNPFAFARLLWSAIILGNVPSLTVSFYDVFY